MKTQLLTLALCLLLFIACDKDEDTKSSICQDYLPAITTTGANTFGCCINGNLLIPRNGAGTIGGNDYGAILYGGYPNLTDYYELDIRDFKSEKTGSLLLHMHQIHITWFRRIYNKSI